MFAIKNFDIGDLGKMKELLTALPPLSNDKPRAYVLRLFIDNLFERSMRHDRRKQRPISSEKADTIKFEMDASFDASTLDIDNMRRVMSLYAPPGIRKVFEEAVHRHKSKQAELRRFRAESRSTAFEATVGKEA